MGFVLGIVALALLAVVYGLMGRAAGGVPHGSCGDCALSSICKDWQSGQGDAAVKAFGGRDACEAGHSNAP